MLERSSPRFAEPWPGRVALDLKPFVLGAPGMGPEGRLVCCSAPSRSAPWAAQGRGSVGREQSRAWWEVGGRGPPNASQPGGQGCAIPSAAVARSGCWTRSRAGVLWPWVRSRSGEHCPLAGGVLQVRRAPSPGPGFAPGQESTVPWSWVHPGQESTVPWPLVRPRSGGCRGGGRPPVRWGRAGCVPVGGAVWELPFGAG